MDSWEEVNHNRATGHTPIPREMGYERDPVLTSLMNDGPLYSEGLHLLLQVAPLLQKKKEKKPPKKVAWSINSRTPLKESDVLEVLEVPEDSGTQEP